MILIILYEKIYEDKGPIIKVNNKECDIFKICFKMFYEVTKIKIVFYYVYRFNKHT